METRRRLSLRLRGYDYTQPGAYFITIVTEKRICLFGEIVDDAMRLNTIGEAALQVWHDLSVHYAGVCLETCVIMPNHLHGIISLGDFDDRPIVGAGFKPAPTTDTRVSLSEVVRGFKTFSARQVNVLRGKPGTRVWQRGFHDHIIRDVADHRLVWDYIEENPRRWMDDEENG